MGVRYVTIDGEKVSEQWFALLHDIRFIDKVAFHVNEGHRTLARQAYFYALYRSGKGPIAAVPGPNAPHIRSGRFDHAIDFNNAEGVKEAAAKRGVTLTRTVLNPDGSVREEWHLEANATELQSYFTNHHYPTIQPFYVRPFVANDKVSVKHAQRLLRHKGFATVKVNGKYDLASRKAVGRFQHAHKLKVDRVISAATWRALQN